MAAQQAEISGQLDKPGNGFGIIQTRNSSFATYKLYDLWQGSLSFLIFKMGML